MREHIISEIKRIAKQSDNKAVSKADFIKLTNIPDYQIYKHFKCWNKAVSAAGLTPNTKNKKLNNDKLFQNLYDYCVKIDKIPTATEFKYNSNHAIKKYRKNFGAWPNVLLFFQIWLQENHSSSKFIDMINQKIILKDKKQTLHGAGAPLDFKGLKHEPINEQGLIFLFSKMNEELGLIVETLKIGFPDCIGKRLIDKNNNLWESVSIEFEYKSKDFLSHRHDANKCDIIVCWIHDWHDCPIEVIELKDKVNKTNKH